MEAGFPAEGLFVVPAVADARSPGCVSLRGGAAASLLRRALGDGHPGPFVRLGEVRAKGVPRLGARLSRPSNPELKEFPRAFIDRRGPPFSDGGAGPSVPQGEDGLGLGRTVVAVRRGRDSMGGRSVAVVLNQVRGVAAGRVAAHPAQQRGRGSEAKKLAPLQEEASVFMHQNLWEGGRGGPAEEEEHSEAVGDKTDVAGAG